MPFQKNNKLASKDEKKDSYLMVRVTSKYKASVNKVSRGNMSKYIINLIDNDMRRTDG